MRRISVPLGVVLLVDVLRVWLPSLITIFGQAGATPAELLGAFALSWFLLGLGGPALVRLAGPTRVGAVAAAVLAVGRLTLIGTSGTAQLYVACVALVGGLIWLTAVAAEGSYPIGVGAGAALAAIEHAATGTFDLTWRGVIGWVLVGLTVSLFVALLIAERRAGWQAAMLAVLGEPARAGTGAGAWFLAGPALFLAGQIGLSPAVASTALAALGGRDGLDAEPAAGDMGVGTGIAVTVLTAAAIGLFCWWLAHPPRLAVTRLGAAFVLVAGTVCFVAGGRLMVVAVPAVALGLGACLGLAAQAGASTPARRGYAVAGGMLVFVVGTFAYYAAYDAGYPNVWVPPVFGLIIAGVALRNAGLRAPARQPDDPPGRPATRMAVGALALVAITAGSWWTLPAAAAPATQPGRLRLVTYNIRMAFGLDGRFSVNELAAVIRAQHPDVVTLSEVDRGWLLNGGHDDLALLARAVGMRYVFGPAADPFWGDAVLTSLPVRSWSSRELPADGPIGAQALGVVLGGGSGIAVVATHLQPASGRQATGQARAVAAFANELRAPGRPVVIAGDLNTQPGEEAFEAIVAGGFVDALAGGRPLLTDPADAPVQQLDHVFVSEGRGEQISAPRTAASDHLPVAVTLAW